MSEPTINTVREDLEGEDLKDESQKYLDRKDLVECLRFGRVRRLLKNTNKR